MIQLNELIFLYLPFKSDEEVYTNDDIIDDLDKESILRNSNEEQSQFNQTSLEMNDENNEIINEHSEIEGTTILPNNNLDNLNVTFPSLTRIIGIEEEDDEQNILNSTNKNLIPMGNDENILDEDEIDNLDGLSNEYIETNLLRSPASEECGRNRFNNLDPMTERIIGGSDTMQGEIPWIASVRLIHPKLGQVGHVCMGVLISLQWVATASHCTTMFSFSEAKYWQVRLGKHNIRKKEQNEKTYQVVKLFNIKNYAAYDNDLALLKLEVPVETNQFIRPICIPSNDKFDLSYRECYVSGWGKESIDSESLKRNVEILKKVKVNIYDNLDCQRVYYPRFKIAIKNWHLCAGNKLGNAGTCHGDSGSPLQCKVNNRYYLFGITSFGSNCAKPGFPDVYTKITFFLKWIKEKIKNE